VVIRNFNVIHCGDDAVAIKSGKDSAGRAFGMPSFNILIEGKRKQQMRYYFYGHCSNELI
jgi:polygalacturonase